MELDKNAPYLLGAYAVFLGGLAIYLVSLVLRKRNIDRDEQVIQQIEAEANQEQKTQNAPR
jgi:heme exporter protein D